MADNILEIRHLSKSFGTHEVLRDIDFDVKKGDVISIIGASGSGKSTLLRCVNLLETPTSGDILYHGPRNDLPRDYAPKRVIPLLNALADRIIAVRGNCDAEVDQMVLDFPVMADYATLFDETGRELFLTHGHVFGAGMHNSVDHAPALPEGSALVYGHTHIKVNEASEAHPGLWLFNPGSVSIPKDGSHSYGIYEGGAFRHVILEEE